MDNINDYNQFAIYLRWCIEQDLFCDDYIKKYAKIIKKVKTKPYSVDLRAFIKDELNGQLNPSIFNKVGKDFTAYYYGDNDSPSFPQDIENYALEYLGPEKYYSDDLKFKASDLIPFDETYYKAMANVITKRFSNWHEQIIFEDALEPSILAKAFMKYLDCECTYFPPMADDDPVMSAYSYARREGVKKGFVPVLINVNDEGLLEYMVMNSDPRHSYDIYTFDLKTVKKYRNKMLTSTLKDGKAILRALVEQCKKKARNEGMDWDEDIFGRVEDGRVNDTLFCHWDILSDITHPIVLAKIPVKNPWEIFAYLPLGCNDGCPDTPYLMAVAKYWYEKFGAITTNIAYNEVEFYLPTSISYSDALETAEDLYGFCPNIINHWTFEPTLGPIAHTLFYSTVWDLYWE